MTLPLVASALPLPLLRRGKVREVYEVDPETLLLVASDRVSAFDVVLREPVPHKGAVLTQLSADRKSTRLNSSHGYISYAVFCLKKKKKKRTANTSSEGMQSTNEMNRTMKRTERYSSRHSSSVPRHRRHDLFPESAHNYGKRAEQ